VLFKPWRKLEDLVERIQSTVDGNSDGVWLKAFEEFICCCGIVLWGMTELYN